MSYTPTFKSATRSVAPEGSGFVADYYTDGVNDEVEIQAAIDAASLLNGNVLIKRGTYTIQSAITVEDNVHISGEGWGTVLDGIGTTAFSVFTRFATSQNPSTNWVIRDLKIDCTDVVLSAFSTSAKGIFTTYSENCQILNVWVYNSSATAIGTDFMVDCLIQGCVVESFGRQWESGDFGGNGIGIGTGAYANESCVISDCFAFNGGNNGIMFENQNNSLISKNMKAVNCISRNNRVGFRTSSNDMVTFSNCTAYDNTDFGIIIDNTGFVGSSPGSKNIRIVDCDINENEGAGILFNTPNDTCTDNLISGCNIFGNEGIGIKIVGGQKLQILNNKIHENDNEGIKMYTGAGSGTALINNVTIQNNQIYNNGQAASVGNNDGIKLEQNTTGSYNNILIQNNRIFDDQESKTQRYGFTISGVHNNLTIRNNDFVGNNTGALNIATTSSSLIIEKNIGTSSVNEQVVENVKNTSGGELNAGAVVVMKAVAAGNEITTTTTQGDDLVYGMLTESIANNAFGYVQTKGKTTLLKVDGTTDIAIGDPLCTFTSAGIAAKAGSGDMAFAIALEAYSANDSSGVIDALLITPRKI